MGFFFSADGEQGVEVGNESQQLDRAVLGC